MTFFVLSPHCADNPRAADGLAGLVSYAELFIADPDLPMRFDRNRPLALAARRPSTEVARMDTTTILRPKLALP